MSWLLLLNSCCRSNFPLNRHGQINLMTLKEQGRRKAEAEFNQSRYSHSIQDIQKAFGGAGVPRFLCVFVLVMTRMQYAQ
jgi:hypothetical protein